MLTVCITGGSGFIGKNLVKYHLEQGDSVRVLSRRPEKRLFPRDGKLSLVKGDLALGTGDLDAFVYNCDILYHCAGELYDEGRMYALHVTGTWRLISLAAGRIGYWVQLGSIGSYGPRQDGIITEKTPTAPVGTYETTKTRSDQLVEEAARNNMFSCTILRPSIVFGPTMTNRSLFQLIWTIDKRLFFFIGPPGASANYIHVDNVVNALVLCGRVQLPGVNIFNLSDQCLLEHFVTTIAELLRCNPPGLRLPSGAARLIAATLGRIPGFPLTSSRIDALSCRARYATDAIRSQLNYTHRISMEEGLAQMVTAWKHKIEGG